MHHMNRRTTPKVVGGRPQRKNRWERTPNCYNTRQELPAIDRRGPGPGYRLSKRFGLGAGINVLSLDVDIDGDDQFANINNTLTGVMLYGAIYF